MKRCAILLLMCFCAGAQTENEALAQKAVEAERRGDFPTAIAAFRQLVQLGEDSPELRNNLGIALYQSGDFHGALQEFAAVLSKSPNSGPASLFYGLSLLNLQRPKEALPYLNRANRARPDDVIVLSAIARANVASNQVLAANDFFRHVTRLDPKNAPAWYGLGITDRLLAEAKVKAARQKPARSDEARREIEESQTLMNDFQRCVSTAMQLEPESVQANMIFGESFRIAEQYGEAVREYKTATEKAPGLAAAWAGLATAQSASGDDESALKTAEHARKLDEKDPDTATLIAAIYVRMGDFPKAEPFAREALRLKPDLATAHVVLARVYVYRGQSEEALEELQAAEKDDLDGSTHYLLATTLRKLGRPGEAAVAMREYSRLHRAHLGLSPR
ncbi:MAG: tetratricopeptide repeat protein [Bryobacteraceae bacterium]